MVFKSLIAQYLGIGIRVEGLAGQRFHFLRLWRFIKHLAGRNQRRWAGEELKGKPRQETT